MTAKARTLGDRSLFAIGLGCYPMSGSSDRPHIYGRTDHDRSIRTIHAALDAGIDMFDTAQVYGPYRNEELLAEALEGRREQAFIATKFGFKFKDGKAVGMDSRPDSIRTTLEDSLRRLKTDHVDLYYQHRVDPRTPIEDVVGTLAALKTEGKIRYAGLSEPGADTLKAAIAAGSVDVVQSEYSLWERTIETEILPIMRAANILLVPYSPLGRGFLTGSVKRAEELGDDDYRSTDPRFQGENFDANLRVVAAIRGVADEVGGTAAQVALAWLLHQGDDVLPIPGTTRPKRVRENAGAADIALSDAQLAALDTAAPVGATAGPRYGEAAMAMVRR